ncbi:phospholipase A2 group V isoform X1 [Peromyscus californicus insignis]|uniref:phospholipase A2 group V isoform X1 n=2 Tax=Peromyscus californicus insignis TaxID=564181 RepID=UPI0022A75BFB|nr:phospholipase A2 group V isoform X1 [Peromyscus californicus insignis]
MKLIISSLKSQVFISEKGALGAWVAKELLTQEMKGLLTLAWFLACSVPAVPGGLLELKSMIAKVTGKDPIMNYGFYGCYCGWGGKGTPKDGTDWCCQMHDRCYGELEENGCSIWTQSYNYRFIQGLVVCEYMSYCPGKLCDCDRKLVYCLRRNLWSYNPLYQYYPNFLC